MPMFEFVQQVTGYDIEDLKNHLENLAIEVVSAPGPMPTIPPTTAADKATREAKLEEYAARLHDICVQRNKFDKMYDKIVIVQIEPNTNENVEAVVTGGAKHSVEHCKGFVGAGPPPEYSGMAKEEAKRLLIRAAINYYNMCLTQAAEARQELDAAVAKSTEDKDTDSEATTSIESSDEAQSQDEPEVDEDTFKGKVDAIYELPDKKSEERKRLWDDLKINSFILEKENKASKQGLYSSRDDSGVSGLTVTFDKSTIRPIVSVHLDGAKSVDCLTSLSRDDDMDVYLTSPAVPVFLRLTYNRDSPAFPDMHKVKVEAEMGPATFKDMAQNLFVLQSVGKQNGTDSCTKWQIDVGNETVKKLANKPEVKGNSDVARVMRLVKKNPIFERC